MKRFIDTLKNIWAIKELRNRLLYTLILLVVFRLGSYIVLPGVMSDVLSNVAKGRSANDLLGLINIFTGGAFNQASILALGIMPYITAAIINNETPLQHPLLYKYWDLLFLISSDYNKRKESQVEKN